MPDTHEKISSISAVFPAYYDGGSIASMVTTAQIILEKIAGDFEIIVVNDGSRDYTGQVLDELTTRFPKLRLIVHEQNQGYGKTIRDGFSAATKDWVFYTDGDAQYNPLEMETLAAKISDDVDLVNGYKVSRHDPFYRKWIGSLYHVIFSLVFGIKIRDINCDFRLIRRSVLESIVLESNDGSLGLELIQKLQAKGCRIVEVPVTHYPRAYGVSQFFSIKYIFRTAVQIMRLGRRLRD